MDPAKSLEAQQHLSSDRHGHVHGIVNDPRGLLVSVAQHRILATNPPEDVRIELKDVKRGLKQSRTHWAIPGSIGTKSVGRRIARLEEQ